uniref:C2H2-type domain-containing protein n=1 Tax=Cynoglossus semilaevis TaxID=244447 RepID=A0A3P8W9H1_CYNSE
KTVTLGLSCHAPCLPEKPSPREEGKKCQCASSSKVCGTYFKSNRGLSSHARAHLRQIGVPDNNIKCSPIDFLYQLMEEEDLKPLASLTEEPLTSDTSTKSSFKRPADLSSPSSSPSVKRLKVPEECILCGDEFENRKGLGSHARSHLRQMGMIDLMGKNTAIETIEELVKSGMLKALCPSKKASKSSSSAVTFTTPASPDALRLSPAVVHTQSAVKNIQLPLTYITKAPKAKKGSRFAVDPLHRKTKPESVEIDISVQPEASIMSITNTPTQESPTASGWRSPPTVPCDFCGQLFETRKALSCHARAHLRQLGLNWSIKTSPIDLLKEVMEHGEPSGKSTVQGSKRPLDGPQAKESSGTAQPVLVPAFQMIAKLFHEIGNATVAVVQMYPSKKCLIPFVTETSCELCGFNFENRKALASHARAHLRQLGIIEWKADGARSPIELLSELIRKDPVKVAAITPRPQKGDPFIQKAGNWLHPPKHTVPTGSARGNQDTTSQQPSRSGSIPAMLPKPPLTPLVKLVGKVYSLKCRFCEEVFHGPLSVQEQWITHLQKHILSLGYKGKDSPPAAPVEAAALVHLLSV